MSSKTKTKKRWKPTIGAPLGPQEQKLHDVLKERGGEMPVKTLFRALAITRLLGKRSGGERDADPSARHVQQRIGAIASRYNKKRRSPQIVPGDAAGTYRLRRVR